MVLIVYNNEIVKIAGQNYIEYIPIWDPK